MTIARKKLKVKVIGQGQGRGSGQANAIGTTSDKGSFDRASYALRGICHGPVSVCLRVCVSVTSWCSTKMAKWIELNFGMEASFEPSHTVL